MPENVTKTESELTIYRSIAGSLFSLTFLFSPPFQQRLLVASGINGDTVIDSESGLNGKLHNGYGLITTSIGIIELLDKTISIVESTISFIGTVTIDKVNGYYIQFGKGTLSRLQFTDTLDRQYEFIFCESYGISNIIHNLYTTSNVKFSNFTWNYNNEYFGLTFNDWQELPDISGVLKVEIPYKLNGTSNYLSPTS